MEVAAAPLSTLRRPKPMQTRSSRLRGTCHTQQAPFIRASASGACAALAARAQLRRRGRCCRAQAEVATLGRASQEVEEEKPRALQLVQIDLKQNKVVLNESDLEVLERSLQATGVEKVAIIAVMGAFRTGKSFLLDLMLRYLREKYSAPTSTREECEVPEWVQERGVPDWAVNCGPNLLEGREGGSQDREGFVWRPGMEKCTEGIWVWSEVFVCKAGGEDVAVMLMDTQGAWDARMSKEQSATIFGLTTLLASRLIYNVSKQIQQDKIDNLLYFTDFAKAALRAMQQDNVSEPFQTLEFLVRDWPHFEEKCSLEDARSMMKTHLDQYFDPQKSQDTKSVEALADLFHDIDVWCLPHPSLKIESEGWDGDLAVIERNFWRFIDGYLERIFDPSELQAKQNLGNALTVSSFATVLREFSGAFSDAAPQAKTFSEAMEASTGLLARDVAIKKAKEILAERALSNASAITDKEFDDVAAVATQAAVQEFSNKAIFGTAEGIQRRKELLLQEVKEEISRARDENERKLEASLTGLTNFSIVGLGAFALDRVSDITCDWWSGFCREASTDLTYVYVAVFGWVGFNLYQISEKQGQLNATAAALELLKTVVRQIDRGLKGVKKDSGIVDVEKKDEKDP